MFNHKEWYQRNRERLLKRAKERYQENLELERKKDRQYYDNNKEKRKRLAKEYRKKNPDKVKAYRKRYQKANPLIITVRAYTRNYFEKDKDCGVCHSKERLEFHHWVYEYPVKQNHFSTLCNPCHEIQHLKSR